MEQKYMNVRVMNDNTAQNNPAVHLSESNINPVSLRGSGGVGNIMNVNSDGSINVKLTEGIQATIDNTTPINVDFGNFNNNMRPVTIIVGASIFTAEVPKDSVNNFESLVRGTMAYLLMRSSEDNRLENCKIHSIDGNNVHIYTFTMQLDYANNVVNIGRISEQNLNIVITTAS